MEKSRIAMRNKGKDNFPKIHVANKIMMVPGQTLGLKTWRENLRGVKYKNLSANKYPYETNYGGGVEG